MIIFWGIVIVALGIGLIAGSYYNWNWFMKIWKEVGWVNVMGRNRARIFYAIIGLIFVVLGLLLALGVFNLEKLREP